MSYGHTRDDIRKVTCPTCFVQAGAFCVHTGAGAGNKNREGSNHRARMELAHEKVDIGDGWSPIDKSDNEPWDWPCFQWRFRTSRELTFTSTIAVDKLNRGSYQRDASDTPRWFVSNLGDTPMTAQLTTYDAALKFIFGGKSTFTFRSLKTGDHIAFKVNKAKDQDDLFFIKAARHTDLNEGGFNYLAYCKVTPHGVTVRTSKKSHDLGNALPAFEWVLGNLIACVLPDTLEIWHGGRCCRCNRQLTDPESIASGIGPECRKMMEN